MRFPAGKQSTLHKGSHPHEVLDTVDRGYVRLTVEDHGLNDHYILYHKGERVGALSEFSDGRFLCGKEALDYILSLDEKVLAQTVTYSEKVFSRIKKNHPEIFFCPESEEKFKVGDTIFTGMLCAVKKGDLLSILNQLEADKLIGCLRVTEETPSVVREGVVLFLGKPKAAIFETEKSVLLGDEALREIALSYTEGRIYHLDDSFIKRFLVLNNASRLKDPVEESVASEKATDDLKRFVVLQMLNLERGTHVLNAPCNGTFSFEALLKSAASRKFDGYLWVRSESSSGLMVLGQGRVRAVYAMDSSGEFTSVQALRRIYEAMDTRGTVDFYQLSYSPLITQSFEAQDSTDNLLIEKLIGEMEADLINDVKKAKEFKKRWKDKRKNLGE